MALKYAPTLVIGVGTKDSPLACLVDESRAWLSECYPKVTPIVRFGLADENGLQDRTDQVGEWVGENLTDGLRRWLESISETGALEQVRESGVEVLGTEQLVRRFILLLDDTASDEQIGQTLDALSEAVRQIGLGVNLLVLVITRQQSQNFLETLRRRLANLRDGITPVQIIALNRYLSDGSNIAEEALPIVLRFLLLTALAPYESEEHWLFVRPSVTELPIRTVGVGLMYVPLPQISEAAGNYLAFQLSQFALSERPPEPQTQEWWEQLQRAFHEPDRYRDLFVGIEEAIVPTETDAEDTQAFQVRLREGLVKLELSGVPWHKWTQRLADLEALWTFLCEEFWLPQIQENAEKVQRKLDESLRDVLNQATQHGVGVFAAAEELLKRLSEHLQGWRFGKVPRGVVAGGAETLQRLDEALHKVPHPNAIVARFLLSAAVIAYTTFALARWSWLSGFLVHWLQNFLSFVQPWMVPAIIGLMGVFALVRVGWNGWRAYAEGVAEVERARDEALQAIATNIASVLREAGLQALEDIHHNMVERVKELNELNRKAKEALSDRLRPNWESKAKSYDPADTELTRAVLRQWAQLQGLLDERLKKENGQELWQQVLKEAQVTCFDDWCNGLIKATIESNLAEAAEDLWRTRLQGDEMRRLSFYLKPIERREQTREELVKCYKQSQPLLWQSAKEGLRWRILADDEQALNDLAGEVLSKQYGEARDWQVIHLPAIVGFLRVGEVEMSGSA